VVKTPAAKVQHATVQHSNDATLQHAAIGMQRATDNIQHSLRTAADRGSQQG
jgi:hypothetical protein